jgi:hypothetical protein
MKLAHTPHRFYQFDNPQHAPFDQPGTRWPTIVGKFFAPICRYPGVKAFVFLDHGAADIELRLACRNYTAVEAKMDRLAASLGVVRRPNTTTPGQTVGNGAYQGPDWIEPGRGKQWAAAHRRSELLFRHLHAGCALYLDTLVPAGPHFQSEVIPNLPLGNLFERCLHLVANFSKAEFDATVGLVQGNRMAITGGMSYFAPAKINAQGAEVYRLHL